MVNSEQCITGYLDSPLRNLYKGCCIIAKTIEGAPKLSRRKLIAFIYLSSSRIYSPSNYY